MRSLTIAAICLLFVSYGALWAAPHDTSADPLPDPARAVVAINAFSTGPWVKGDWALNCYLESGRGSSRVRIPMEVIGGWRPDIGRWQRVRLPNGRQWLVKDILMALPASADIVDSAPISNTNPFGVVTLPDAPIKETNYTLNDRINNPSVAVSTATPIAHTASPVAKPKEGGIVITPIAQAVSTPPPVNLSTDNGKPLELVYSGKSIQQGGVSFESGSNPTSARPTDSISPQSKIPTTQNVTGVWELGDKAHILSDEDRQQGINERIPLSWELYTMNFLNLPKVEYKDVEKVRARWCDKVELTGSAQKGGYPRALVWLDVEFGAPLEAELYDSLGNLAKTVRAVSIQRIKITENGVPQNEWILKQWEVVDAATHNKVVIDVAAVSLDRHWTSDLYDERSPLANWPQIPDGDWKDIE